MDAMLKRIDGMRVYFPPVDAGKLKYFAAVIMLIDHAAYAFLEQAYAADGRVLMRAVPNGVLLCRLLRSVGRQAFPIFCFFVVESLFYTHSRLRYFLQLVVFALLSHIPFQKCFFQYAREPHTSVMCTLALGFLAIWVVEELGGLFLQETGTGQDAGRGGGSPRSVLTRLLSALPAADRPGELIRRCIFLFASGSAVFGLCRLANALHSDYGYGGVLSIFILYLLRDYRIIALLVSWLWMWWYNKLEVYAAPAYLLLACYNGRRGKQSKYFFYLFYPVHLTLLWLLRRYIFGM